MNFENIQNKNYNAAPQPDHDPFGNDPDVKRHTDKEANLKHLNQDLGGAALSPALYQEENVFASKGRHVAEEPATGRWQNAFGHVPKRTKPAHRAE